MDEFLDLEDEYWHLDQMRVHARSEAKRQEISDAMDELLDEILFVEEDLEELKTQCKELGIGVESDHGEGRDAGGGQDW